MLWEAGIWKLYALQMFKLAMASILRPASFGGRFQYELNENELTQLFESNWDFFRPRKIKYGYLSWFKIPIDQAGDPVLYFGQSDLYFGVPKTHLHFHLYCHDHVPTHSRLPLTI